MAEVLVPTKEAPQFIRLTGVSTNNLKNIDVEFPLGKFTVVTGVSGSGKSSLVFDTLYSEAYRRYVESLSSYARQFLKALVRPVIREVENLPPAVAVGQRRSGASNRSTVGTLTELLDLVRILFAELGHIECSDCRRMVRKETPESIAKVISQNYSNQKVLLASPLFSWEKVTVKELKRQLEAQGFTRYWREGEVGRIADAKAMDLRTSYIIIDRITEGQAEASRLVDSIALAMRAGRGQMAVISDDGPVTFSAKLECLACLKEYLEPTTTLLSHQHPLGACGHCQGFGFEGVIDNDRVFPDLTSSLADHGVLCWNFGKHVSVYTQAIKQAHLRGLDPRKSFAEYTAEDWLWLRQGSGRFIGLDGYFRYLDRKKYKAHYRIHAARFRKYVICSRCQGQRLNEKALAIRLGEQTMATVSDMAINDLQKWISLVASDAGARREDAAVADALEEAAARLEYVMRVGCGYLSLGRSARTLSGGELQRINMARTLGSALTETLFCLDEPTAGLHPRDSLRLLEVVRAFKDLGNTVVVVEHEQGIIDGADHLIEIGPKSGRDGGLVVYSGESQKRSLAAPLPETLGSSPSASAPAIKILGASTHNLKSVDVQFPVGKVTAVCGVSGSGKTSLIQHTLFPLLAKAVGKPAERKTGGVGEPIARSIGPLNVLKKIDDVMLVSQAALGRSSRSTIGTYLGVMDEIRKLLAEEPLAKKKGLKSTAFSFNTKGGRCEECRGLGTVVVDLSFLGEMEVICPSCEGRRFQDEVLAVRYRGKSLIDILQLTVTETRELFYDRPAISRICDAVEQMGMGYLTLGQNTSSFSGGEAQRLKLLSLFRDVAKDKKQVLIFDEPTTGLSDRDVGTLIAQFRRLTDRGHTVIVVEHHVQVMRDADWLVEVGPDAGDRGGEIVFQGNPKDLTEQNKVSATAPFLWSHQRASRKDLA